VKVYIICVTTACGRIEPGPIGTTLDRRHLENMRAQTNASLLGAGTLREGDPEMRGPDGRIPGNRIRAFITGSGKIPVEDRKVFRLGPPPVIFTGPDRADELGSALGQRAHVVPLPEGPHGLSLRAALDELGHMGAETVLIEGGARLNFAALAEGIVDELVLTVAPRLSGDRGAATLADGPGRLGQPFLALDLLECLAAETGELFLKYRVVKDRS